MRCVRGRGAACSSRRRSCRVALERREEILTKPETILSGGAAGSGGDADEAADIESNCWRRWQAARSPSTRRCSQLKKAPFEDLGYAKVDLHRALRQGAAEVIYGAGKTAAADCRHHTARCSKHGVKTILITRLVAEAAADDCRKRTRRSTTVRREHIGICGQMPEPTGRGKIVVATGGTSRHPRGRGGGAHRRGARQPGCAAL